MSVQSDFNQRDRDNRDNLPWRPLDAGTAGGRIADIAHSQNAAASQPSAGLSVTETLATWAVGGLLILALVFYDRVYLPWKRSPPPPRPAAGAMASPPAAVVAPPVVRSRGQPWFRNPGDGTAYLAGLPTPERAMAAMRTADPYETAVRQSVALERLARAAGDLMGQREFDPQRQAPAEVALRKAYLARMAMVPPSASGAVSEEERRRFVNARTSLQFGPGAAAFHREWLERTTDAAWRTRYVANWAELAGTTSATVSR